MTTEELKSLALEGVADMRAQALSEQDAIWTMGDRGKKSVNETADRIVELITRGPSENPSFTDLGEASAALVMLALTEPETYGRMMERVYVTENVTVAQVTYELMRLSNFLSQVSDDHNYVMDVREDGSPVVCIDGSTAYFLGTISPHSLLEVLRPIVYGAAPPAP